MEDGLEPLEHFGVQVEGTYLGVCGMGCRGWLGSFRPMDFRAKKTENGLGNFLFVIGVSAFSVICEINKEV